ncbi:diguanylate cyclase domain-containing protein [Undibacterium sp. Xuan67W]|uniref:sensor domain-containing protein n=1 Tax=Undibacterium sp. Xuan67W TaxID=3413057 RepID=UPI003BEFAA11
MEFIDQLPCCVLITNEKGIVIDVNAGLLATVGIEDSALIGQSMDLLFPPAGCIFLQTHIWPMLLKNGQVKEIYLKMLDKNGGRIPVMFNCSRSKYQSVDCYIWLLFVAQERSKFEAELITARNLAESSKKELEKKELFIKTITDATPALVGYWDKNLVCQFANQSYVSWFGKPTNQIIGHSLPELLGERLMASNQGYVDAVLRGEKQIFERILTKADGSIGYGMAHYIPDFNRSKTVIGFFVLVSDITSLKNAENELHMAASVFQNTIEGIMVTDADAVILSVNPAFTQITGYSAEEAIGKTPKLFESTKHDSSFHEDIWEAISTRGMWEGEVWNQRKNGDVYPQRQTITRILGNVGVPTRYVSIFNDISDRWYRDETIRKLALQDALTGLPNRPLLMERLHQLLAKTDREKRNISVMFLDLDQFKNVNDSLGHEAGDILLKEVAKKLLAQVRKTDTVSRLGGDEFVILLDNPSSQQEVVQIAHRIITSINIPFHIDENTAKIGTSIGIAVYPDDGITAEELIKSADKAMYKAKEGGKNRYCFLELPLR